MTRYVWIYDTTRDAETTIIYFILMIVALGDANYYTTYTFTVRILDLLEIA